MDFFTSKDFSQLMLMIYYFVLIEKMQKPPPLPVILQYTSSQIANGK